MYRRIFRGDKRKRRKMTLLLALVSLLLLAVFYHNNDASATRRRREKRVEETWTPFWGTKDFGITIVNSTKSHLGKLYIFKSQVKFQNETFFSERLLPNHKRDIVNASSLQQNRITMKTKMAAEKLWREFENKDTKHESYEQRKHEICRNKWQGKYSKLHKDILQSKQKRRFIVYSCREEGYGCAGYGNRLGAITSLLFLSIITERAFLIEWGHGVPLDFYLHPKGIEWNYSLTNLKDLSVRKHYWGKRNPQRPTKSNFLKSADVFSEFIRWFKRTDFQSYFDRQVEEVVSVWYFANHLWRHSSLSKLAHDLGINPQRSEYSLIGCAFDFLFQMSKELEAMLTSAKTSLGLTRALPTLGLHIRMGDISFGKKNHFNTINYESFFLCAKVISEMLARETFRLAQHNIKWFLATDDNEIKRYALQNFPENVVALNIIPRHIVQLRRRDSESINAMYGVLLDHLLLSECDFLILSKSTFGTTAAGLRLHSNDTYLYGEKCGGRFTSD